MMKFKIIVVVILIAFCVNAATTAKSTAPIEITEKKESKKRDAPPVVAKEKSAFDYTAPSQSGYDASSGFENSAAGYDAFAAPQVSLPSSSYGTPLAPPLNEHTYNAAGSHLGGGGGGHNAAPEYSALHGSAEIHGNDLSSYGSPHGSIGAVSVAALTQGLANSYPSISFGEEDITSSHAGSHGGSSGSGTYQTIGYEIADHTVLGGGSSGSHGISLGSGSHGLSLGSGSHGHSLGSGGPPVIALGGHGGFSTHGSGSGSHGNHGSHVSFGSGPSTSYGPPKPWVSSGAGAGAGKGWQSQSSYSTHTTLKPWVSQSNGVSYGTMSKGWINLGGNSSPKGWTNQRAQGPKFSYNSPSYNSITSSISLPSHSYGPPAHSHPHHSYSSSPSHGSPSSSYGVPSSSYGAPSSSHSYSHSSPSHSSHSHTPSSSYGVPSSSYGLPSSSSSSHGPSSSYGVPSTSSSHHVSHNTYNNNGVGKHQQQRPDYSIPSYAQGHKGLKHYSSSSPLNSISSASSYNNPLFGAPHGGSFGGHSGSGYSSFSSSPYHGHGTHSFGSAMHPNLNNGGYHSGIAQSYNSGPQKQIGGAAGQVAYHAPKNTKQQIPLSFSSKPIQSFTSFAAGSKAPFKPSTFLGTIGGTSGVGDDVSTHTSSSSSSSSGYEYHASPKIATQQRTYLPPSQHYGVPASGFGGGPSSTGYDYSDYKK